MARIEGWSVRTLRARIDSMLYERTALSKQPDTLIRQELAILRSKGDFTPVLLLKDPYVLGFLGLTDRFLERDLEDAILRELETFLLELGAGFSFVARQKRIQLDGDDFYIDLLFYNRKLRRLVVVAAHLGGSIVTTDRWFHIQPPVLPATRCSVPQEGLTNRLTRITLVATLGRIGSD